MTFLNPVAERLTGWPLGEAEGHLLAEVFHIINEATRQPVEDPVARILRENAVVGLANHTLLLSRQGHEIPIEDGAAPIHDDAGGISGAVLVFQDATERQAKDAELRRIEWMLSPKAPIPEAHEGAAAQRYGDLTALNTSRLILDSVGPDMLRDIVSDYMDLLETSSAVYERNGDYAFGTFASGWCQFMDQAARDRCGTSDDAEALRGGRWLCHESCWTDCSKVSIEQGDATDIECQGGLHLYAVPIRAGDEIVGSINFGYGDPPRDPARQRELAEKYGVPVTELQARAAAYHTRPPFIIDMAKRRLHASARLIGEIVRRKRAEEALREKTEELDRFFSMALDLLCIADTDGFFRRLNTQWETVLGYSLAELEGRRFLDLIHPEDLEATVQAVSRLDAQQPLLNFVNRYRCKDGSYRWLEWRSSPRGKLIYAAARDITERKRAEEALRESEERLRLAITATNQGLYDLNVQTGEATVSPEYATMLGYDPATFRETNAAWIERTHPDDHERVAATYRDYVAGKLPSYQMEFRQRTASGDWKWILSLGKLISRDAAGQPLRMLGTHTDITQRKGAESALRESEERFAVFMENLPAGAFMKDVPGAVVYANRYLCDLFGWGNIIGRSTRDLLPPEVAEKMEVEDRAALVQGLTTVTEKVQDATKRERVFQTSKFPIARAGRAPLLGGIAVDVTERIQAEEALRTSLEEKVVLIKEVHHRVKNNLQIISSLLNLQARKAQHPEVLALLRDTQGRIRAMSLLHEALYRSDNLARVSFRDYVQTVCLQVIRTYAADTRSIHLRQDIAEVMLSLDQAIPAGLILNELLSNALKHAFADRAQGEIAVQLQVADERHYALRVADDGVGLPAATDPQDTETLGLRLVDSLVRQLDGELTVIRDVGTVFQIVFPRRPS